MEPTPKIKTDIDELWLKIPKKIRWVLIVIICLGCICWFMKVMGWLPASGDDKNINININNDVHSEPPKNSGGISKESEETPGSISGNTTNDPIKQKVTDFHDWINYGKFDPAENDENGLTPPFSKAFPEGRTISSPFVIGPRFEAMLKFKPISTNRENVTFSFGNIFRCIIGNGNYKHIDCESPPGSTNYLIEKNQDQVHAWVNRRGSIAGIKPITTQFLTVVSEPLVDSELLNVKLTLKFIPAGSTDGQYSVENFEYDIPTGTLSESLQDHIGLGIVDPYSKGKSDEAGFELNSLDIY